MGASPELTRTKSLRAILSEVKMGLTINRYEFSVAAAKRAREIHALTADSEDRSQQRSLLSAVLQITSGETGVVREDEEEPAH